MTGINKSSYARILKTSSILGSSSLIDILFRVIRTKILAVFLGPASFGLLALYSSLVDMIISITSLGIGQSAVRDISKANVTSDRDRVARVTLILRRVVWVTGGLGLLVTVCIAYPASFWMFDDDKHIWSIGLLGIIVLFSQIKSGQMALLSGLRLISEVARANILGSFLGTLVAVPLIIWLGKDGIIPFLIVVALGQLIGSWRYARKQNLSRVQVNWRECMKESSSMLRLGLVLMVSGVALAVSAYFIKLILQQYLGEESVGIYQASYTLSGIYIGFILQAMSGDFFPHLTAISDDEKARNKLVNEQMDMAILIAVPGLILLLLFSDVLFSLLYSERFIGGSDVLRWQVLGMLGRIISWPMGFILLARSDKLALIISEIAIALAHVFFVWWGVQLYGVEGAGIAFTLEYFLHIILMVFITKRRHDFVFESNTLLYIVFGSVLVFFSFGSSFIPDYTTRYLIGSLILLSSIYWGFKGFENFFGREMIKAKCISFFCKQ